MCVCMCVTDRESVCFWKREHERGPLCVCGGVGGWGGDACVRSCVCVWLRAPKAHTILKKVTGFGPIDVQCVDPCKASLPVTAGLPPQRDLEGPGRLAPANWMAST